MHWFFSLLFVVLVFIMNASPIKAQYVNGDAGYGDSGYGGGANDSNYGGNDNGGYGQPSPPSGTITANPNPCSIPNGQISCHSIISWTSSNTTSTVNVYIVENGGIWAQGTSGALDYAFIPTSGGTFILRDGTTELSRVFVYGVPAPQPPPPTGWITANPNPCTIPANSNVGTSHISWATANTTGTVQIKVAETNGLLGQAPSGAVDAPWIGTSGYTFVLYDRALEGGPIELARLQVRCVPSATNLSGTVFVDNNGDCVFNAGDSALWTEPIQLIYPVNSGSVVGNAATNSSGNYVFNTLTPAVYQVKHARLPTGYVRTCPASDTVSVDLSMSDQVVNFAIKKDNPPSNPNMSLGARNCNGTQPQTLLQWDKSTNTVSYDLWRLNSTGDGWDPINTNIPQPAGAGPIYYWDLPPLTNQQYWYVLYARSASGLATQSVVYAKYSANCVAPIISIAPGCSGTAPKITLYWDTTPRLNNLATIVHQKSQNGGAYGAAVYSVASNLNYPDTSVVYPSSYQYQALSVNNEFTSDNTAWWAISPFSAPTTSLPTTNCVPPPPPDTTSPTISFTGPGLNGTPIGCFDSSSFISGVRSIDFSVTDSPPPTPPSGVDPNSVKEVIYNTTLGNKEILPWQSVGAPVSSSGNTLNYQAKIYQWLLAENNSYSLYLAASDKATPPNSATPLNYNFVYRRSCLDWIQTRGGNVHSEGQINVPGGP